MDQCTDRGASWTQLRQHGEIAGAIAGSGTSGNSLAKLLETVLRGLIVNIGFFPSGAQAPAMVVPTGNDGPAALTRAMENLERMDTALTVAEEKWGKGLIATHFRLGPMSAADWRKFHYVHGCHHLKQIRKRAGLQQPQ
jgi:hypothetical protein